MQGLDKRVLEAAAEVMHHGLAKVTLLGDPAAVAAEAKRLGLDISLCTLLNPEVGAASRARGKIRVKTYHKWVTLLINRVTVDIVIAANRSDVKRLGLDISLCTLLNFG